jgi:homoserine/homoserine lactone efflux protein
MIDFSTIAVFAPTFFLVSISPGMCMMLAMTLGMTIGIRRTLWMMLGELVGVALVGFCAVVGVATIMLSYPTVFAVFKYIGGAYLIYIGVQMWRSKGEVALVRPEHSPQQKDNLSIATQGFVTAIANPKGWAFMITLLPPFINASLPMAPQLTLLLAIVVVCEFICMMIYASGGKQLGRLLQRNDNVANLNKFTGTLMVGVGLWLALG